MAERIIDQIKEFDASKEREGQHQGTLSVSLSALYGELATQDPEMLTLDLKGEHNQYHLRLPLDLGRKLLGALENLDL